ncbi:MAG: adenosine deaminase [Opitutae bacterium]|nr:adenosine deaminase [Opitutae bacterium]
MRRLTLLLLALCLTAAAGAKSFTERFEAIKRTAAPAELYTFLYALPKGGDLHNHLGGAIRSEWWYAAAIDPARNGGDVFYTRVKFSAPADTGVALVLYRTIRRYAYEQLAPADKADYVRLDALTPEQKQGWLDSMRLDRPGEGRDEFFTWIWPRTGQLHENIHVVANVLVDTMRAYGAEGLRYLETQMGGTGYVDNDGNAIPEDESVRFFKTRLAQPDARESGVTPRFQVTVLRFVPNAEQRLADLYAFVDAHRDLWVALNMAGIEENGHGYPLRFLDKYRELRRRHPLALSIHAGEMDGPDSHIRDTLLLGATRIGHGVNLIKDSDTLLLLQNSKRVLVEINLISNRLLEYTPDLTKHPFPEYLRTGVPVCLNTDDRGMWDSNMTDEYYTAVTTFNLSWDELVELGRNSLAYSFVQPDVKARLLADYERDVAAFEAKYLADDSLKQLGSVKPVTYGYAKRTWGFEFKP